MLQASSVPVAEDKYQAACEALRLHVEHMNASEPFACDRRATSKSIQFWTMLAQSRLIVLNAHKAAVLLLLDAVEEDRDGK